MHVYDIYGAALGPSLRFVRVSKWIGFFQEKKNNTHTQGKPNGAILKEEEEGEEDEEKKSLHLSLAHDVCV